MKIYGAGLAGLLAAHVMRRYQPVIHEAQSSLPNNHEALLRFRSDAVAKAVGIPFKKVHVTKAIFYQGQLLENSNIALNNMYSEKVTGSYMARSSMNLQPADRWVAPMDLVQQLAQGLHIEYNSALCAMPDGKLHEPVISTIPMGALMKLARWPQTHTFFSQPITTLSFDIDNPPVDLYQTIYFPEDRHLWYRISITGNHIMAEMMGDLISTTAIKDDEFSYKQIMAPFGIFNFSVANKKLTCQKFGKIIPIMDDERRRFILAMSDLHGIYSVGRFATWRQILMDDVVHDIEIVKSFIEQRSNYGMHLSMAKQ